MAPATTLDRCPNCKIGTFIREELSTNGPTKHFSCGHRVVAVGFEATLSCSVEFGSQHGLGPHNTANIGGEMGAVVMSMQQEMYKDALFSYREARSNHAAQGDIFTTWRHIRVAILFSFAAIESCINQFIDAYVEQNRGQMPQSEIDRWTEAARYLSIDDKLKEGIELFGGNRLSRDTSVWADYQELKKLRDQLVHYKAPNSIFYDTDQLLKRTDKAIRTAGSVVKKIYLSHPKNTGYPSTFDDSP